LFHKWKTSSDETPQKKAPRSGAKVRSSRSGLLGEEKPGKPRYHHTPVKAASSRPSARAAGGQLNAAMAFEAQSNLLSGNAVLFRCYAAKRASKRTFLALALL
jgi:hypothetical protein